MRTGGKEVERRKVRRHDLFAVDEHLGGLGGGHYRAYAKDYARDSWYHFDDSYVTPATPNEAIVSLDLIIIIQKKKLTSCVFRTQMRTCSSTGGGPRDSLVGNPLGNFIQTV